MGNLRDSMPGERSQLAKQQRHGPPECPLLAKRRSVRCDKRHQVCEQHGDGGLLVSLIMASILDGDGLLI
jgi:hypothetical protein